jgi:uncharacterized membrane protein HdeD (DUF308 family)
MNRFTDQWWMLLARGITSFAFVAFLLLLPGGAGWVLPAAFGLWAVADGAGSLAFVYGSHGAPMGAYVGRGVLGITLGLIAFALLGASSVRLFVLVGLWAMSTGGLEMAFGVRGWSKVPRALGFMLVGLLTLGFGLSLVHIPLESADTLRWFLVAFGVVNGVAAIILGEELHPPPQPASSAT